MKKQNKNTTKVVVWSMILVGVVYVGVATTKIVKWQLYTWLPQYWIDQWNKANSDRITESHVIFTMVDHYEPGNEPQVAIENNAEWLSYFEPTAKLFQDSYGNPFRYTWFYAYDQANDQVIERLSKTVYSGLGEIELHWHHPNFTNESFDKELNIALQWFNRYGAMTSSLLPTKPQFSFIHGNWALDASTEKCGVDKEIAILKKYGGYMDMTFSTIGVDAQPNNFINQLYYVEDTPDAKSYEHGSVVSTGQHVENQFLIFQGPIGFNWKLQIEYGAIESYSLPSRERVEKWIDANIHVKGKPEWIFVKVYSHGIQSIDVVKYHLAEMLKQLSTVAFEKNARLHFMTAREAYNVVKAAEAGMQGDPENYRNYVIAPPVNSRLSIQSIAAMNNGNKTQ